MSQVRFFPAARRELLDAEAWMSDRAGEDVVNAFMMDIESALDRIERSHNSHPLYPGTADRWVQLRRFPYIIVYRRTKDEEILIVAVAHESRAPGYWQKRK